MRKHIVDGKVAILVSGGWGAGWSTWNNQYPEILFDPNIVYMVEAIDKLEAGDDEGVKNWQQNILSYCEKNYPDGYFGGIDGLYVTYLPQGTLFRIDEYDGSEHVEIKESNNWIEA